MALRFRAVPIVPLLLALPAPGFGLQVEQLGSITGTVRQADRGPALVGARVSLLGTTFAAITTARGEFAFNGLTPGKYVIQASAIGFGTLSSEIEVRARETLEVAFEAQPEAVRLPELNVAEKPNLPSEFVRRSEGGGGRYISRDAIERRNAATLGDLLRTVPGLRVNCAGYPCRVQLMRQRNCPMAYWLDGAPVDAASAMLQSPRDLDGVEIYSGLAETPPELFQRNTCGALVVWTRTPLRAVRKPKQPKPVKPDTVGVGE
ncbi:MAG TPA: TonB-dependent receptor [Gemmatimonadales bacterium]|jgi:hypothetical protein|nr:TonB-dependent receptor [Gemmatimonadales bacterium]